jgi:hypothetical protein
MTTEVLTTERARGIASTWQSPGTDGIGFAQFASTGTVTDALLDEVAQKIHQLTTRDAALGIYVTEDGTGGWVDGDLGSVEANLADMVALQVYLNGCTVPVWTVGRNVAGYLPESDVAAFLDYADAVEAHRDEVQEAPESFFADEDGECGGGECLDGGESCDFHSMEAEVGAYLRDDLPWIIRPSMSAVNPTQTPRECSIALRPDHLPLPTVFFLARSERLVSDYLAEQEA